MLPAAQLLDSSVNTKMANDLSNKVRVTKLQAFADIATRRTRPPARERRRHARYQKALPRSGSPQAAEHRLPTRASGFRSGAARDSGAVRNHAGGSRAAR